MKKIIVYAFGLSIFIAQAMHSMDAPFYAKAVVAIKSKGVLYCLGGAGIVIGGGYATYKAYNWLTVDPQDQSTKQKKDIAPARAENLMVGPPPLSRNDDESDELTEKETSTFQSDPEVLFILSSGSDSETDGRDESDEEKNPKEVSLSGLLKDYWQNRNGNNTRTPNQIVRALQHPRYQDDTRDAITIFLQWTEVVGIDQEQLSQLADIAQFGIHQRQNMNHHNTLRYEWAQGEIEGAHKFGINDVYKNVKALVLRDERAGQ